MKSFTHSPTPGFAATTLLWATGPVITGPWPGRTISLVEGRVIIAVAISHQ